MNLVEMRERYWSDLSEEMSALEFQGKTLSAQQIVKMTKIMKRDFAIYKHLVKIKPKAEKIDLAQYENTETGDVPVLSWKNAAAHYLHDKFPMLGQDIIDLTSGVGLTYEKVKRLAYALGKEFRYLMGDFPPKEIREYK